MLCQYPAGSTETFLTSCLTHRGRNASSSCPEHAVFMSNYMHRTANYTKEIATKEMWRFKTRYVKLSVHGYGSCLKAYFSSTAHHLLGSSLLKRGHGSGLLRQQEQRSEDPVFQSHGILQPFTQVAVIWPINIVPTVHMHAHKHKTQKFVLKARKQNLFPWDHWLH